VFTIVGGGFGLYGYLPALLNVTRDGVVLLAEKYRKVIESRSELRCCMGSIEWCPSIVDALSVASGAVIATPPSAQKTLVEDILSIRKVKKLIIEKPICPKPNDSISLISALAVQSKHFRVGYTFLHTDWYRELQADLWRPAAKLHINWVFKADHFIRDKDTWKKYHSLGGGVMRFYGIQLLAVLASLGYSQVASSQLFSRFPDQPEAWIARFSGTNVPPCLVYIATNSNHNDFHIEVREDATKVRFLYNDVSPFRNTTNNSNQDSRVSILERLIYSMDGNDEHYMMLYNATNALWAHTEMLHTDLL
jgi:predicted dehydrogenase